MVCFIYGNTWVLLIFKIFVMVILHKRNVRMDILKFLIVDFNYVIVSISCDRWFKLHKLHECNSCCS